MAANREKPEKQAGSRPSNQAFAHFPSARRLTSLRILSCTELASWTTFVPSLYALRRGIVGLALCLAWPSAPIVAQEAVPAAELPSTPEEKVVDVRVDGNKAIPLHKIAPHIQTRAGRPYSPELVEEDVRRLNRTRQFVNVNTSYQRVPEGVVVVFQVIERPTLSYVKYLGATLKRSTLDKNSGIKVGDAIDPYMVDESRRKLEEYYQSKGFSKARVVTLEGNKPGDRGRCSRSPKVRS